MKAARLAPIGDGDDGGGGLGEEGAMTWWRSGSIDGRGDQDGMASQYLHVAQIVGSSGGADRDRGRRKGGCELMEVADSRFLLALLLTVSPWRLGLSDGTDDDDVMVKDDKEACDIGDGR